MHSNQLLWQYNLLLLPLRLIKSINLDNEVYFIDIPNKLRRATSPASSEGFTNNSQSRATSTNYPLNIN